MFLEMCKVMYSLGNTISDNYKFLKNHVDVSRNNVPTPQFFSIYCHEVLYC